MTALGKLLVVFNFMIACFLVFCVVLLWSATKNWKAKSEEYKAIANENYKGAEDFKKRYDDERERMNAAVTQAKADADKFRAERDQYALENKLQKEAYDKKLSLERQGEAQTKVYDETIKSQQNRLDTQSKTIKTYETELTDLNIQLKNALVSRDEAQRERKAYFDQVERLKEQIKDINDRYTDLLTGRNELKGSPLAPENFRGTVQVYKDDYVEITPGLNAGLKPGTRLLIRRLEDGGKFIGYLTIGETVNPDKAVGRWSNPNPNKKLTASDYPRKGDEVVPMPVK